jgi:hypothetical protein
MILQRASLWDSKWFLNLIQCYRLSSDEAQVAGLSVGIRYVSPRLLTILSGWHELSKCSRLVHAKGYDRGKGAFIVDTLSITKVQLPQNFDIFLDINDRFLISINLPMPSESDAVDGQQGEDDLTRSWNVFNGLCQRVLDSILCALEGLTDHPLDFEVG